MNAKNKNTPCPCGGGDYRLCCGLYLDGGEAAPTAVKLMRSRYTAFTLHKEAYLRATWLPETLPEGAITSEDDVKWTGLKVVVERQDDVENEATVEYIASFKVGGRAHKMHEISSFTRRADATGTLRWYYVSGVFPGYD